MSLDTTTNEPPVPPPPPGYGGPAKTGVPGRLARRRGFNDGEGRLDLRNAWQVIVGSILIPAGVVVILIGWYGAAHARVVQQQIPYMVSGSFIGLGLMITGGLMYWAHWMYRLYDQADLHHEEQLRAMEQFLRVIARHQGAAIEEADPLGVRTARIEPVVATPQGSVFHRESCPVAARNRDSLRTLSAEEAGRMEPCGICRPEL